MDNGYKNKRYALCLSVFIAALLMMTLAAFGAGVVVLDAGHQGEWVDMSDLEPVAPGSSETKAKATTGTTGHFTGVPEYQLNLDICLKLETVLKERGYEVVQTRRDNDTAISNSERALLAANSGGDVYVRIHANGSDSSNTRGALAMTMSPQNPWVGGLYEKSYALALSVLDAYCNKTGFPNLGIQYEDDMTGINWSRIPVMILEMGFMTNETDDRAMQDEAMQEKMAEGIADGLDAYFAAYKPQGNGTGGNNADLKTNGGESGAGALEAVETDSNQGSNQTAVKAASLADRLYEQFILSREMMGETWAVGFARPGSAPEAAAGLIEDAGAGGDETVSTAQTENGAVTETESGTENLSDNGKQEAADAGGRETAAISEENMTAAGGNGQETAAGDGENETKAYQEVMVGIGAVAGGVTAAAVSKAAESETAAVTAGNSENPAAAPADGNADGLIEETDAQDKTEDGIISGGEDAWLIHGDAVMQSASVIKLFIMGCVYDRICFPSSPEREIPFTESYSGELRATLESMIRVSSNEAANALIDILGQGNTAAGMAAVNEFAKEHGYTGVHLGRKFLESNPADDNYVSAAACVKFYTDLYEGKLVNEEASGKMLDILKGQTLTEKIPSGLPAGYASANKTGEMPEGYGLGCIENDTAIIWPLEGTPYVLVVLSNNLDGRNSEARQIIRQISAFVAQELIHGN